MLDKIYKVEARYCWLHFNNAASAMKMSFFVRGENAAAAEKIAKAIAEEYAIEKYTAGRNQLLAVDSLAISELEVHDMSELAPE